MCVVWLQPADACVVQCPDDAMHSVARWVQWRSASNSLPDAHAGGVGVGDAMRLFDVCSPPDSSPGCDPMCRASCSS